ncbi:uncharacterized protein LOC112050204 [Bicyclus anynana]|uniref:Uncharacterized protein LOC112050204 n=1 Tax=Bicyclus anynana TaxID=110368 RepID=A0ABM3LEJ2_BICAN|nr:uncharacterized protein LOC112050204 [Bicyclus anynana]
MQLTIYIVVGLMVATANARFVWKDDDDVPNHHSRFNGRNFPAFPSFPHFNFPKFPNFPEIKFPKPQIGSNGVAVIAQSSSSVGKDGKTHNTGEIVTSNDGVVKKITYDNGEPNVVVSVVSD